MNENNNFVGYEYHSVTVGAEAESAYADGYESFGWIREDAPSSTYGSSAVNMKFKRDRKIRNKAELTRLQRQFDVCMEQLSALKKSAKTHATLVSIILGVVGCAFLGGAMFAYLAGLLPLMIILAIPGFLGWILPYFCYHGTLNKQSLKNAPRIDQKQDEIYDVCEKACQLLA